MKNKKTYQKIWLTFFLLIFGLSLSTYPQISMSSRINVKILYDFSGSMYPGYNPGKARRPGVKYFHQYSQFKNWFKNFISAQGRLNGTQISMSVFRSLDRFSPQDIIEIHHSVPISSFNVDQAFSYPRKRGTDYTYLADSLDYFTRSNFEGLVWLISDNIVETSQGNATTKDFFKSLRDKAKYRSVHIYNLPFLDPQTGQKSDLAVYGLLVSPHPIDNNTATWFDKKFYNFSSVFSGQGHLKLKDLEVNVMEIVIKPVEIDVRTQRKIATTEGDYLELQFETSIKNNLSMHTITGGILDIELCDSFVPDAINRKKYGIENIPANIFDIAKIYITQEIPPAQTRKINNFTVRSTQKIPLAIPEFWDKVNVALARISISYNGYGRASSKKVNIELKNEGIENIKGIYGSEDIGSIFLPEKKKKEIKVKPTSFNISFSVYSSSIRGFLVFLPILVLAVLIFFLVRFARKSATFILKVAGKEIPISLKMFGKYDITYNGEDLGYVRRGIGKSLDYYPNDRTARLSIKQTANKCKFEITIDERDTITLYIEDLKEFKGRDPRGGPPRPGIPGGLNSSSKSPRAKIRIPKIRKPK